MVTRPPSEELLLSLELESEEPPSDLTPTLPTTLLGDLKISPLVDSTPRPQVRPFLLFFFSPSRPLLDSLWKLTRLHSLLSLSPSASELDASVPSGKEVEHLSTDGPHGLVWKESEGKYVHRREL